MLDTDEIEPVSIQPPNRGRRGSPNRHIRRQRYKGKNIGKSVGNETAPCNRIVEPEKDNLPKKRYFRYVDEPTSGREMDVPESCENVHSTIIVKKKCENDVKFVAIEPKSDEYEGLSSDTVRISEVHSKEPESVMLKPSRNIKTKGYLNISNVNSHSKSEQHCDSRKQTSLPTDYKENPNNIRRNFRSELEDQDELENANADAIVNHKANSCSNIADQCNPFEHKRHGELRRAPYFSGATALTNQYQKEESESIMTNKIINLKPTDCFNNDSKYSHFELAQNHESRGLLSAEKSTQTVTVTLNKQIDDIGYQAMSSGPIMYKNLPDICMPYIIFPPIITPNPLWMRQKPECSDKESNQKLPTDEILQQESNKDENSPNPCKIGSELQQNNCDEMLKEIENCFENNGREPFKEIEEDAKSEKELCEQNKENVVEELSDSTSTFSEPCNDVSEASCSTSSVNTFCSCVSEDWLDEGINPKEIITVKCSKTEIGIDGDIQTKRTNKRKIYGKNKTVEVKQTILKKIINSCKDRLPTEP
ncbi:unnamed protein product [Hymenolepis diminuta]|uniref:Uncharacterized protein n=1 Tax=Hymenolepis diminuta TaxID=6216 RepID=A0A564YAB5_HYMDI|nr:unnamed protein product [Hymenolepis diminuta]